MEIILQAILLVVGFVMLIKGADWFVEGAAKIADKFGIPQLVIGLTIVAMGTSLPEAAVSISAALKNTVENQSAAIAIGNVVGSNIMNILLILGLTAVIRAIPVQKSTIRYEIPFVIGISILLMVIGYFDGSVGRLDGIILWMCFIVYWLYLWHSSKKGQAAVLADEVQKSTEKDKMWKLILLVLIGMGLIVLGSDVTVDAATALARIFGMSERLIGLTIVAFGTSLPELITSATAAIKGKADIAVGNIVGSNIFNILFVIGTAALITNMPYAASFQIDSIVCILSAVLLLICVLPKKKLTRAGGAVMLAGYAAYFVYLVL